MTHREITDSAAEATERPRMDEERRTEGGRGRQDTGDGWIAIASATDEDGGDVDDAAQHNKEPDEATAKLTMGR
jgi:hypothetical protein